MRSELPALSIVHDKNYGDHRHRDHRHDDPVPNHVCEASPRETYGAIIALAAATASSSTPVFRPSVVQVLDQFLGREISWSTGSERTTAKSTSSRVEDVNVAMQGNCDVFQGSTRRIVEMKTEPVRANRSQDGLHRGVHGCGRSDADRIGQTNLVTLEQQQSFDDRNNVRRRDRTGEWTAERN